MKFGNHLPVTGSAGPCQSAGIGDEDVAAGTRNDIERCLIAGALAKTLTNEPSGATAGYRR
jgi:hypothetical protein